jgi:peptidoglycan/xylan/chitin deacetylase (PgdA/CDA1 family)
MPQALVLCYHAVSDSWDAPLAVTQDDLRTQLKKLLSRGWVGTTFTEAMQPMHPRTLAVTFDDAFDSVHTLAAPVLAELGLPGTVFVPAGWVGRSMRWPGVAHWADTEHAHELQAMSWDSLRELAASGWEVGSHTCSHPHLSALDPEDILAELQQSRAICEQMIGAVCRSVAYPFGDADEQVRAAARAAGYEAAAGLSGAAFVARDLFDWPRVGVWHNEPGWRFDLKVLPITSSLRRTRGVASALDVARKLMRAERSVASKAEVGDGSSAGEVGADQKRAPIRSPGPRTGTAILSPALQEEDHADARR